MKLRSRIFRGLASSADAVVSGHVKPDSGVNLAQRRRRRSEACEDRGGSREVAPRSSAQLITAIISLVASRDKGSLAQPLIMKRKVVCLLVLWEDVEIKAEGLILTWRFFHSRLMCITLDR